MISWHTSSNGPMVNFCCWPRLVTSDGRDEIPLVLMTSSYCARGLIWMLQKMLQRYLLEAFSLLAKARLRFALAFFLSALVSSDAPITAPAAFLPATCYPIIIFHQGTDIDLPWKRCSRCGRWRDVYNPIIPNKMVGCSLVWHSVTLSRRGWPGSFPDGHMAPNLWSH